MKMKKTVDYSKLKGFNYTQSNCLNDRDFWARYDHSIVDRDLGYAERLHLNSVRIFMDISMYRRDPQRFLSNIKDFVRTAWEHGICTNPILFMGFRFRDDELTWEEMNAVEGLKPLTKTIEDPSCWHIGEEYVDAVIAALRDEPGLLFWDIANEPGYTDRFVTWYDEEFDYLQEFQEAPDLKVLRERQEKTWAIVRHFMKYVKEKDPDHDVGVGNIFIYETEASGTAEIADVIVFHDYSCTRKRLRNILQMAANLSRKYGKPVLNNEMCCIGRANPYDMAIQMHEEFGIGWFLFELMIGEDSWRRVHGVCYPDGTVRDPSIVAAILGFYRNRSETAVRSDVNQEDYVNRAVILAKRVTESVRQNNRRDHSADVEDVLEVAEYAANLLEGGELVPMAYPPTARIEAMRRRKDGTDVQEALDLMYEILETLTRACHVRLPEPYRLS